MHVEVVFALPDRQELVALEIEEGATVGDAVERSEIAQHFPEHDLAAAPVGIWGRMVGRGERVGDGDRIEIYRPLHRDPQAARRERAG